MHITRPQICRIYGLLHKEQMDTHDKEELVVQYSPTASPSIRSLTFDRANQLIQDLGGVAIQDHSEAEHRAYGWLAKENPQHAKIVSLLLSLGWFWEKNPKLADVAKFGRWIKHFGKHKKPIRKMNTREISDIINQLESILYKSC